MTNVLQGKPYVGPGTALSPVVWVEDAGRAHAMAIQRLLQIPTCSPASATSATTTTTSKSGSTAGEQRQEQKQERQQEGSQQDDGSAIAGRAFHLSHDPITDPFLYADFAGGTAFPPLPSLQQSGGSSSGDAGSGSGESAAHGQGQGQRGGGTAVNAYGMPVVGSVPRWLIGGLARVNEFTGRVFGVAVIDPRLFKGETKGNGRWRAGRQTVGTVGGTRGQSRNRLGQPRRQHANGCCMHGRASLLGFCFRGP